MERASKATEDQHCPVCIVSPRQARAFETRVPEVEAEQSRGSPGPREPQMEFCSALPLPCVHLQLTTQRRGTRKPPRRALLRLGEERPARVGDMVRKRQRICS